MVKNEKKNFNTWIKWSDRNKFRRIFKQEKNYQVLKFDIVLRKPFDLRNFRNYNIEKYIKKSDFVYFLAFDVGGSRYLKNIKKHITL